MNGKSTQGAERRHIEPTINYESKPSEGVGIADSARAAADAEAGVVGRGGEPFDDCRLLAPY
jgi:hypothetical protein